MKKKKSVAIACFLAWVVPGGGHFYAGYRLKGAILFVLILGLFVSGIVMHGGLFSTSQDFISFVCAMGRVGVGLPWLAAFFTSLKVGDMLAPFGEVGACYTTVAGLLNLLVVISIRDLINGKSNTS